MTKRRTGFLVALSLTVVAMATAFASQAQPAVAHSRSSAHGKYTAPAVMYYHGPGGCQDGADAAYDGSDL
jgi:hypothetical protein